MRLRQGDVYWLETESKRRPVLIVTRDRAIPVLNSVVVAPITRTVRGIPTEVPLGVAHGLRVSSVASFDNTRVVRKNQLTVKVGSLPEPYLEICRAFEALADC